MRATSHLEEVGSDPRPRVPQLAAKLRRVEHAVRYLGVSERRAGRSTVWTS